MNPFSWSLELVVNFELCSYDFDDTKNHNELRTLETVVSKHWCMSWLVCAFVLVRHVSHREPLDNETFDDPWVMCNFWYLHLILSYPQHQASDHTILSISALWPKKHDCLSSFGIALIIYIIGSFNCRLMLHICTMLLNVSCLNKEDS